MNLKRKANKALALLLALSLAISTNMPISAFANEAAAPETESAAAEITYVKSGEEVIGINLNANPAVIVEAKDVSGNTVPGYFNVFHDANRNGAADAGEEKLAIEGETAFASTLNVYGTYNNDTTENILITMNSGAVADIYGMCEAWGGNVNIDVNGGTANGIYGVDTDYYEYDGNVEIIVSESASVANTPEAVTTYVYHYGNIYIDYAGALQIGGKYTIENNIEADSLKFLNGTFVLPSGVTLTVDSLVTPDKYSGTTNVIVKGTLNVGSASGGGKFVMAGGTVAGAGAEALTLCYKMEIEKNIENAPLSISAYGDCVEYEDEYYVAAGGYTSASASMPGYDVYYSVNGAEYKQATGSFYIDMPETGILELAMEYVPKQISVENKYSGPKGVVGQTYTADKPLCDLSMYPITNDTTAEYGGEVKYAVKKATPLPEGLSLVKGKIIGTPKKACEDGQKVTVVVTGRNGSTANLNLTIKITESGSGEENINELVLVDVQNKKINLNGTSVVVMTSPESSYYAAIYPDMDHDKLPDNNKPLIIDGDSYYSLSGYELVGYSDAEKDYNGDISITLQKGSLKNVYGIYGTEAAPVTVEGDVSIYLEGASVSNLLYGACYGKANNVTVSFTKGLCDNVDMCAAYESEIERDVNLVFKDQASLRGTAESNYAVLGAADSSTIKGDVNVTASFASTDYGFRYYLYNYRPQYWTRFTGVSNSSVAGNINYSITDIWIPSANEMVKNCTVGKDVVFNMATKNFADNTTLVLDSAINGDLKVIGDETTGFKSSGLILISGSSAEKKSTVKGDLYFENKINGYGSYWEPIGANVTVENGTYISDCGIVRIGTASIGEYVISEDFSAYVLTVLEGSNVKVAEGVTVELTSNLDVDAGAKLVNYGTISIQPANGTIAGILENHGVFTTTSSNTVWRDHIIIDTAGKVENKENGVWNVGCYVDNNGVIINNGSFVQTYYYTSGKDYFAKLGTVYTTKKLIVPYPQYYSMYTVYDSASEEYNSVLYYAVNVDYPSHCIDEYTLTSGNLVSGPAGDTTKYIKAGSDVTFTIKPGTVKVEGIELEKVLYGPNQTEAQESAGVYSGSMSNTYQPLDITLYYVSTDAEAQIVLDKTTDTVENLTVGDVFTEEEPLYDLTSIPISGDLEIEDGEVLYTLKEGTLPDGIVLKDGKLFGTLTTAAEGTSAVFTVKGLNQTTADFTLTFGAVAKAVPQWSVPTGFTTTIQSQVQDIELPTSEKGTYEWGSVGESVGSEVGTITTNLIFTPEDTDNYDWAAAAQAAGIQAIWNEENQTIICVVSVQVEPGEPEVTAPTGLTAIYGQTFAQVSIRADENGTFEWDTEHHALTDFVGEVGDHTCYVTYVPTNKNYKTKSGVEVTLTVNAATPDYKETLTEVEVFCDETLGDVLLPDADGGRYQWVSATTTEPEDGASYQVIYIPEDTTNYDWTTVTGWNKMRKGIVFSVTVKLEHAWGEGKVTKPATEDAEGVKTYTCGLCDETRTEVIPKLPNSGGGNGGTIAPQPPTPEPPKVGYAISDSGSKAVYKVSKVGAEVTYVKPDKKTYTKVKVPKTVKYEGVTYKVTAIANNAFKKNTKMTKVTIGANVKTIGNSAFQGCTSLKSVTIPKNVTKIGKKAFFGCKKLMKMTIKTTKLTEKSVGKKAFTQMGSSNYKKLVVKVPKKQKKAYTKWLKKRGLNKNAKIK